MACILESSGFWDSKLFLAILPLVGAAVGFCCSQYWEGIKKEREKKESYRNLLKSAIFELRFYEGKLKTLSEFIAALLEEKRRTTQQIGGGELVTPSFSLYPELLGEMQKQLCSFMLHPNLVEHLGNCYFELNHIRERLTKLQQQAQTGSVTDYFSIKNLDGFLGLIENGRESLKQARLAIAKELEELGIRIPGDSHVPDGEKTLVKK